jgi:hypothetical protein
MLIRRCVWHRTYHSYPLALGVASWRGFNVSFTDGMCRGCAIQFRREWNLPAISGRRPFPVLRVAVSGALAMLLVVAGHASDRHRTPSPVTSISHAALVPTLVETSPSPRIVEPSPQPRHLRATPARPAPTSTVITVARRTVEPEPDLFAEDMERESVVLASVEEPAVVTKIDLFKPSSRGTRFYAGAAFAAVPGAGLTTQTP